MTKRELIEALEALECSDDTEVVHGERTEENIFMYEVLICLNKLLIKDKPCLIQLVTI